MSLEVFLRLPDGTVTELQVTGVMTGEQLKRAAAEEARCDPEAFDIFFNDEAIEDDEVVSERGVVSGSELSAVERVEYTSKRILEDLGWGKAGGRELSAKISSGSFTRDDAKAKLIAHHMHQAKLLTTTGSIIEVSTEANLPETLSYVLSIHDRKVPGNVLTYLAKADSRVACLREVLSHPGIDPNERVGYTTAATTATEAGNLEGLNEILKHKDTRVNDARPIILAVGAGEVHCMKRLLEHPEVNIAAMDRLHDTVLSKAMRLQRSECVKVLLAHPRVEFAAGAPLVTAAYRGFDEGFTALLNAGCSPNHRDFRGYPALYRAAQTGRVNFVETLLAYPDIEVDFNCLQIAAARGHDECLRLLVAHYSPSPAEMCKLTP